ncbi:hypothetical protein KR200_006009, partial [Drosophila serrata]
MTVENLVELFRATMDPNPERHMVAEYQLNQMCKIIGFAPTILQIVMQVSVEMPVRQAAAVFLKRFIEHFWSDHEAEPGKPISFSVYEQDRTIIRSVIMDAIVHAPELIRVQLSVCMNHIIKNDFPERWPQVVANISIYLQNQDVNGWNAALVTMYQLVKIYDFGKDRTLLYEAMNLLLPMIYQLMVRLLTDPSVESVLLQKQILKIYYGLTLYNLPMELITKEVFSQWMEICRHIADCDVPDCSHLDNDERTEFPYWKTKKWALQIMLNMFRRYGSPDNVVNVKYQEFAKWYLPTFSQGVIEVLLKILDQYRKHIYVSPRVLAAVLYYLRRGACHSHSWKLIKPYMEVIIQDVIFPILSFSDSDQELWQKDQCEFIRLKFDGYEEYGSPVSAAESFLRSACKKRKGVLPLAIIVIVEVITSPDVDNKQKDGGFHMLGTLADVFLSKVQYCAQMESLLTAYVLPEFESPAGHMRARACWVMHAFSGIQIKKPEVLAEIMRLTTNALLVDKELPVKVQAAICLQMFLSCQEEAKKYVVNQSMEVSKEVLTIIRETEIEDLHHVMQRIFCIFTDQLVPLAIDICQHMATTFSQAVASEEDSHERAVTAYSLLTTFETLVGVMGQHPDVLCNMQPIVMNVVTLIFENNIRDFYDVTFGLIYELTTKTISTEMWHLLEEIYRVLKSNGMEFFQHIMPVLYNYVTVDTAALLSNPNRLYAILDMCQTILTICPGDYQEWSAAKLLEVIILQCKGQIDGVMEIFVEIALSRLRRGVHSSEVRTMCLQVVIAALYYNPQQLISILDKMSQESNESIIAHFINQWFSDMEYFLCVHDRKLCILGLSILISLGDAKPLVLRELAGRIMPALIQLFSGLNDAYGLGAQEDEEDEDDYGSGSEENVTSDEDFLDDMGLEEASENENEEDSDSFPTTIDDDENRTTIDEFCTFKEVITVISTQDQAWYALLTSNLTPEQENALQKVVMIADQRFAAKLAK